MSHLELRVVVELSLVIDATCGGVELLVAGEAHGEGHGHDLDQVLDAEQLVAHRRRVGQHRNLLVGGELTQTLEKVQ